MINLQMQTQPVLTLSDAAWKMLHAALQDHNIDLPYEATSVEAGTVANVLEHQLPFCLNREWAQQIIYFLRASGGYKRVEL